MTHDHPTSAATRKSNRMADSITKESVQARFTELQEINRTKRDQKVTAADVERRLAERKAARGAQESRTGIIVSVCLGVALLAGAGVSAIATTSSTRAFEVETASLSQQIIAAESTLASIPAADQAAAADYSADLDAQLEVATAKGREVAELQQKFAEILVQDNNTQSEDGVASSAGMAAAEHRKLLAPYFVDRAFLVDGSTAYAPLSLNPFGEDQIDPRFPWFIAYQDGQVADPRYSAWSLVSMQPTDTAGVFTATWFSRSPDDALNAWAKASYYSDTEQFGSLTVGMTTVGERAASRSQKAGE